MNTDDETDGRRLWPPPLPAVAAVGWSSFLAACLGSLLCFALLDPLQLIGADSGAMRAGPNRLAVQTLAFFFFWLIAAVAGALSVYLTQTGPGSRDPPRNSQEGSGT